MEVSLLSATWLGSILTLLNVLNRTEVPVGALAGATWSSRVTLLKTQSSPAP